LKLGDANFNNLFARIVAASNPDRDIDAWRVADVDWRRHRIVNWSAEISFQIETHCLSRRGREPWRLVFVHETWWEETRRKAVRNIHWVRLQSGTRKDVLKWFKTREDELDG